ncbi:hypothetical protein [Mucilaginibacter sp.]|uniref:hypothetical protein n=1 Tax=Mucilaginibacter sp. TaxID=1882438 RepID=UPI00284D6196|nr:hypothetical protein [Mucilaginibacter sp.]MDR3694547.1 hypothetical protein [Mucilaginibacter sp.]
MGAAGRVVAGRGFAAMLPFMVDPETAAVACYHQQLIKPWALPPLEEAWARAIHSYASRP